MKRFILLLGISAVVTASSVQAADFKHPQDSCPPGKQTVVITDHVGGGIGPFNGGRTIQTTVCRPNNSLKPLPAPQIKSQPSPQVRSQPKLQSRPQPKPVSRQQLKPQSSRRR